MSRVIVFGLDNRAIGNFKARVNRGWSLSGSVSLQGGLQTTIQIPAAVIEKSWFQLGRMVMVADENLLTWAGLIDVPWSAVSPATVTAYGPEYLPALRTPDSKVVFNGSFEEILSRLIALTNAGEDLFLRLGNMGKLPSKQLELVVDQVPLWKQINDFGKRENVNLFFRPAYETGNPLTIYIDAGIELGVDTGLELHDGKNANITLSAAVVSGKLTNRMIGIGKQDTQQSRPQTQPYIDQDAIDKYRMRSEVVQFNSLFNQAALETATQNALRTTSGARLRLDFTVTDVRLFNSLRPGNQFLVHASALHLPGGVQGWRGKMRLLQMAFDEANRAVATTMEGWL